MLEHRMYTVRMNPTSNPVDAAVLLCTAGLAAAPGIVGLHVAHKWLADVLVYLSTNATAYSAVKVVCLFLCRLFAEAMQSNHALCM